MAESYDKLATEPMQGSFMDLLCGDDAPAPAPGPGSLATGETSVLAPPALPLPAPLCS